MATKKQKRAAALAKHEADMKAYREGGLQALQKDREYRAHKEREDWRANHDKRHSWKKRIKECPICNDEIAAAKRAAPALGEFADAALAGAQEKLDLSKPQSGQFPDVDYGPTDDMELNFSHKVKS